MIVMICSSSRRLGVSGFCLAGVGWCCAACWRWAWVSAIQPATMVGSAGSLRSRIGAGHGGDEVVGAAVGASGGAGDVGLAVRAVVPDRSASRSCCWRFSSPRCRSPDSLTVWNVVALVILAALLIFATKVSRLFVDNRSAFIGLIVLGALFVVASLHDRRLRLGANIKSMLVFAAFLGLASVGQTLVALLGGLDLSIPFLIGSSNVGLLYLIGLGIPSPDRRRSSSSSSARRSASLNGLLSFPLQGQALIVTLGRRLRDLRPHPDPHQHRLVLRRQCLRRGAGLAAAISPP